MLLWTTAIKFAGARRATFYITAVATVLCAPSLWYGLQMDDLIHRAALVDVEGFESSRRPPWELFSFVLGDASLARELIEKGFVPWWSPESLKLAFYRPIAGLTHWVDHNFWPSSPALMHGQSIFWYVVLVLCLGKLYRRMMGVGALAGLAMLLYAIDDAHALPASWLANRNALMAGVFGVLTLIAHDEWRRGRKKWGAFVAPALLLMALLCAESAVSVASYLLAYALFIDHDSLVRRFVALVPTVLVGLGWLLFYKLTGYGAAFSGLYIDPIANPSRYLCAVLERGPLLLWTQWAFPPADVLYMLAGGAAFVRSCVVLAFTLFLAALLFPVIRSNRVARFWACGMILSILPACAMLASSRLLIFVGIGGAGLLAQFVTFVCEEKKNSTLAVRSARIRRAACWAFGGVHLLLVPLGFFFAAAGMEQFNQMAVTASRTLPSDAESQTVLIVQTPTAYLSNAGLLIAATEGRSVPKQTLVLGSSIYPIEVERRDKRTLVMRPQHGFLAPGGLAEAGLNEDRPSLDQLYLYPSFDQLFRDPGLAFSVGQKVELDVVRIEILKLTNDGRPAEVTFTFSTVLEDRSLRWIRWEGGVYVPFELPSVGEAVTLRLRM